MGGGGGAEGPQVEISGWHTVSQLQVPSHDAIITVVLLFYDDHYTISSVIDIQLHIIFLTYL